MGTLTASTTGLETMSTNLEQVELKDREWTHGSENDLHVQSKESCMGLQTKVYTIIVLCANTYVYVCVRVCVCRLGRWVPCI